MVVPLIVGDVDGGNLPRALPAAGPKNLDKSQDEEPWQRMDLALVLVF